MTTYCCRHGKTYFKSEGCPEYRKEAVIDLTNRIYDRHLRGK